MHLPLVFCLVSGVLAEKHLVIVSLSSDDYYEKFVDDIAKFANDLAEQAKEDDQVLVLYPFKWLAEKRKRGHIISPHARCIHVKETLDLWTRDFGFVNPVRPFKFKYEPKRYLSVANSRYVDGQFRKFLTGLGILPAGTPGLNGNAKYLHNDQLIEDGGNIVDNHDGKAILSERFFENNNATLITPRQKLIETLEQSINASVLFIPDPGDTTGHADGVVSFIEPDTLLIADYPNAASFSSLQKLVNQKFPRVKTVKLPCPDANVSNWKGRSAVGVYVNILYTDSSVYVPAFGKPTDDKAAVDIVRANVGSGRKVKTVNTALLSTLGGSIRCMTMQLKMSDPIARKLYAASKACADSGTRGLESSWLLAVFLGSASMLRIF